MLEAPVRPPDQQNEMLFQPVLEQRESSLPPAALPRWVFLQWLARQGWLLHGAQRGGLNKLRPRTVDYHQPDDFSNTRGVYAASDGRWAMMSALRGPGVHGQLGMGLQVRQPDGRWSTMRYFLSYSPQDEGTPPCCSHLGR